MTDPFRITGPAVVSFSGGRTSGYMLWRILQAHGGTLPDDVVVCFANTGREMPATLDFVRDCGAAWNVEVHWLEYRHGSNSGQPYTAEVTYETASRNGEPFDAMLAVKPVLPNPANNMCTIELKLRTQKRFLMSLGWLHWVSVIGFRADEAKRVLKARMAPRKERWTPTFPLYDAGIDATAVFEFWADQPFDLALAGAWEGNCDGCFKKRRERLSRMLETHPDRMAWWAAKEHDPRYGGGNGSVFRIDREDYAEMERTVRNQGKLPFDPNEPDLPCEQAGCGI